MSEGEGSSVSVGGIVKGAIVGTIAALVGSWLVAMPFATGMPKTPEEAEAMTKALMASQPYLLTDLFVSLLCMAIGGYVAAGSAEESGTVNGALTGVVLFLLMGAIFFIESQSAPLWYTASVFILIIPAAALGGKIRGS